MVSSLVDELAPGRPDWTLSTVSAFAKKSRLEGIDGLSDVIASLRLGWRLRNSSVDVAFVHCPECVWGVRLLRRRRRTPAIIAVWHGAGPIPYLRLRRPGHPLARWLARFRTAEEKLALPADRHIAVSSDVAQILRSDYGHTDPVVIIENGLDSKLLDLLAETVPTPGRTGLTALWAGTTPYRKGLDVALAAVREARQEMPGLRLRVAGVRPGDAIEGVDWLGVLSPAAMVKAYRDADLLLFPTRYESFGLVVLEAMAAGLPVIVSDAIAAIPITDGRNGFAVRGHNPSDYAAALRRLADPQVRAAMAEANVKDASRSFESAAADYAGVAESLAVNQ